LLEVFPELKGQKYPELLLEVLRTGIAHSEKEALAHVGGPDGLRSFYFDYEYAPLFQTDGSTAGVIVSVIDITEMVEARKKIEAAEERSRKEADELELKVKERTRELELANAALEVKNQELTSFTYISSHDLQEPLRKIQTFASRILETEPELTSINRQYFTRIQSAAGRMQALIKDLLAYSRTNETDGYEMRDLNGMLREIRTEIRENAEKTVDIQLDTLPVIRIIPFQIHQLFTNIFSNSVKFSKKDLPARIGVRYHAEEGNHIFEVSDNGIGFQPEYSQRIFDVFQRLHGKHEYEGTGIGLSICKKIVENHHGSISAWSEPGQGTTITIRIPQL
jgi:signal transduction histidine kinase